MAASSRHAQLGNLFVRGGVLDAQRLATILAYADERGTSFGRAVTELGLAGEAQYVEALSRLCSLPVANLPETPPPPAVLAAVDVSTCEEHGVVPLGFADGGRSLVVAVSDPTDVQVVDALAVKSGLRIKQQLGGEKAIAQAIRSWYRGESGSAEEFKLVDAAGKTLHPSGSGPTPAAASVDPAVSVVAELHALRSALEAQEKMVRTLMEALVQKQVLTPDDLLRARKLAQSR